MVYYPLLQRIIDGKTTMSPITAVIIIIALNMPKFIVGTNLLNTSTPKPIQSISDDERIALPLRKTTVFTEFVQYFPAFCD